MTRVGDAGPDGSVAAVDDTADVAEAEDGAGWEPLFAPAGKDATNGFPDDEEDAEEDDEEDAEEDAKEDACGPVAGMGGPEAELGASEPDDVVRLDVPAGWTGEPGIVSEVEAEAWELIVRVRAVCSVLITVVVRRPGTEAPGDEGGAVLTGGWP